MDGTPNKPPNTSAAATRKRRSSILKIQRPPRTPFSELEFNITTPTDITKSRRVSFSRRTGVAEFATNEATTTWKNFYEEQNLSLESSVHNSDMSVKKTTGHLGNRMFEQQFQEVEAEIDFGTSQPPRSINISFSPNITDQLALIENEQMPSKNFELSAFTETTDRLKSDITNPVNNETSNTGVNFSNLNAIDDLDEIVRDLEVPRASVGPVNDKSQYIEVNLNQTQIVNSSDMSITDTIHSPKKEVLIKPVENDWVQDKENIVVNPYVTPCETDNFAIESESERVLVFDGKKVISADINVDLDEIVNNSSRNKVKRQTVVFDNTNADMSMTQCLTNEVKNKTMYFEDDYDITFTQVLPNKLMAEKDESISQAKNTKRETIVFDKDDNLGNISFTQCISNVRTALNSDSKVDSIFKNSYMVPKKDCAEKTIVFDKNDEDGNISMTQCIANIMNSIENIENNETYYDPPVKQNKRETIVFDDADISMTQCITNVRNILESTKSFNEKACKNLESSLSNLSGHLIAKKRQTIHFDNEEADISMTQCVTSMNKNENYDADKSRDFKSKTILFDDSDLLSITQCISDVKSLLEKSVGNTSNLIKKANSTQNKNNTNIDISLEISKLEEHSDTKNLQKSVCFMPDEKVKTPNVDINIIGDRLNNKSYQEKSPCKTSENANKSIINYTNVEENPNCEEMVFDNTNLQEESLDLEKSIKYHEKSTYNKSTRDICSEANVLDNEDGDNKSNKTALDDMFVITSEGKVLSETNGDKKAIENDEFFIISSSTHLDNVGDGAEKRQSVVCKEGNLTSISLKEPIMDNDADTVDNYDDINSPKRRVSLSFDVTNTSRLSPKAVTVTHDTTQTETLRKSLISRAVQNDSTKSIGQNFQNIMVYQATTDTIDTPETVTSTNQSDHESNEADEVNKSTSVNQSVAMGDDFHVSSHRMEETVDKIVNPPFTMHKGEAKGLTKKVLAVDSKVEQPLTCFSYDKISCNAKKDSSDVIEATHKVLPEDHDNHNIVAEKSIESKKELLDNLLNMSYATLEDVEHKHTMTKPEDLQHVKGKESPETNKKPENQLLSNTINKTSESSMLLIMNGSHGEVNSNKSVKFDNSSRDSKSPVIETIANDSNLSMSDNNPNQCASETRELLELLNAYDKSLNRSTDKTIDRSRKMGVTFSECVSRNSICSDEKVSQVTSLTTKSKESLNISLSNHSKLNLLSPTNTENGKTTSSESMDSPEQGPAKKVRMSDEVVKTLNFDEDEPRLPVSALQKFNESVSDFEQTEKIIPEYPNNHEGIKELMDDLVKPTADNLLLPDAESIDNEVSHHSMQIQASITSSKVSTRTQSFTDIPNSYDPVIVFDQQNPLNNVLIKHGDYEDAHTYQPSTTRNNTSAFPVLIETKRVNQSTVAKVEVTDNNINTDISMKTNDRLLENASSLTLVGDDIDYDSEMDGFYDQMKKKRRENPIQIFCVHTKSKEPCEMPCLDFSPMANSLHSIDEKAEKFKHQITSKRSVSPKSLSPPMREVLKKAKACPIVDSQMFIGSPTSPSKKKARIVTNRNATSPDRNAQGDDIDLQAMAFSTPKNVTLRGGNSTNVVTKIDSLPFMGSILCSWDHCTAQCDKLCFSLLYGRIHICMKLEHRHENAVRTHVRADTNVASISIVGKQVPKDHPLISLCVYQTQVALERICESVHTANDIAEALKESHELCKQAAKWTTRMEKARLRLAFHITNDRCLVMKVINYPLRLAFEVSFRLALSSNGSPHVNDLSVKDILNNRIEKTDGLLHSVLPGWGHVPECLWKTFKYLKNKKTDSIKN